MLLHVNSLQKPCLDTIIMPTRMNFKSFARNKEAIENIKNFKNRWTLELVPLTASESDWVVSSCMWGIWLRRFGRTTWHCIASMRKETYACINLVWVLGCLLQFPHLLSSKTAILHHQRQPSLRSRNQWTFFFLKPELHHCQYFFFQKAVPRRDFYAAEDISMFGLEWCC